MAIVRIDFSEFSKDVKTRALNYLRNQGIEPKIGNNYLEVDSPKVVSEQTAFEFTREVIEQNFAATLDDVRLGETHCIIIISPDYPMQAYSSTLGTFSPNPKNWDKHQDASVVRSILADLRQEMDVLPALASFEPVKINDRLAVKLYLEPLKE